MNALRNLKIGKKLGLGFGIVLLLTVTLGIVSLAQISKVNGNTVEIATNWLPSVQALGKLAVDTSGFRRYELAFLLAEDESTRQADTTSMNNLLSAIETDEKIYEPLISSDEERKIYNDFRTQWNDYQTVHTQAMELFRENKADTGRKLATSQGLTFVSASLKRIDEAIELDDRGAAAATQQATAGYISARYWTIGLLICALAFGLLVAITLARSITSGTRRMLEMIEEVAANNLTVADMEITSDR